MRITLLCDNPKSWVWPWIKQLANELTEQGHTVRMSRSAKSILKGEICAILACERIIADEHLRRNKHNLVVHESDLPRGRGWSPLTWQILEGNTQIPVTIFEAAKEVDAGPIYAQKWINFEGHELVDELRQKQGDATVELILEFVRNYPCVQPTPQVGQPSFYPRRKPEHSRVDPYKTIEEQFNLLRVVDNERYPAFFDYAGRRYILKIEKVPLED